MGWVCTAGHFVGMNLSIAWEDQQHSVCHCGRAAFFMLNFKGVEDMGKRMFIEWQRLRLAKVPPEV